MRRVRKGRARPRESGYIVTWDVDSTDHVTANRLRRFVFGDTAISRGRTYRYPGFVEKEGVRYLGQSVIFVRPALLTEITAFLSGIGVDYEVTLASLGGFDYLLETERYGDDVSTICSKHARRDRSPSRPHSSGFQPRVRMPLQTGMIALRLTGRNARWHH